jgi:hypothetical protein
MHCDATSAEEQRRYECVAAVVTWLLNSDHNNDSGHFTRTLCLIQLSSETNNKTLINNSKHNSRHLNEPLSLVHNSAYKIQWIGYDHGVFDNIFSPKRPERLWDPRSRRKRKTDHAPLSTKKVKIGGTILYGVHMDNFTLQQRQNISHSKPVPSLQVMVSVSYPRSRYAPSANWNVFIY